MVCGAAAALPQLPCGHPTAPRERGLLPGLTPLAEHPPPTALARQGRLNGSPLPFAEQQAPSAAGLRP